MVFISGSSPNINTMEEKIYTTGVVKHLTVLFSVTIVSSKRDFVFLKNQL